MFSLTDAREIIGARGRRVKRKRKILQTTDESLASWACVVDSLRKGGT
jgi:hypothetical protein